MDEREAKASARVLLAVARADGKVDTEEEMLLTLLGASTVDAPFDLDVELAAHKSQAAKERTMRGAVAVADIDGRCSAKERKLLHYIHHALGLSGELSLAELEDTDGAHAKLISVKIEEATVEFLHTVGSRGHELSQTAYEGLVEELRKKKRELLRGLSS